MFLRLWNLEMHKLHQYLFIIMLRFTSLKDFLDFPHCLNSNGD